MKTIIHDRKFIIKLTAYILVVILFVIYMVNADTVAAAIMRQPGDLERYDGTLDDFEATASAHAFVNEIFYMGDFRETVQIYGVAFAESSRIFPKGEKEGKVVHIVLATKDTKKDIFIGETTVDADQARYAYFKDNYSLASDYLVTAAAFSLVGIPRGTYGVYYYVEENSVIKGFAYGGIDICITGHDTYNALEDAVDLENVQLEESTDFLSNIVWDIASEQEEWIKIQMNGWAINQKNPGDFENAYIRVIAETGEQLFYKIKFTLQNDDLEQVYNQLSGMLSLIHI